MKKVYIIIALVIILGISAILLFYNKTPNNQIENNCYYVDGKGNEFFNIEKVSICDNKKISILMNTKISHQFGTLTITLYDKDYQIIKTFDQALPNYKSNEKFTLNIEEDALPDINHIGIYCELIPQMD